MSDATFTLARIPARPRVSLLRRLMTWRAIAHQRAALETLDSAALKDIGLTPETARAEARRPFWDAADHWLR